MSKIGVNFDDSFRSSGAAAARKKAPVISREPFSPVASFLLGLISGIALTTGAFVLLFH